MYAVRDEKGQIMHYEGMNEEITDRKQTVERIRKVWSNRSGHCRDR